MRTLICLTTILLMTGSSLAQEASNSNDLRPQVASLELRLKEAMPVPPANADLSEKIRRPKTKPLNLDAPTQRPGNSRVDQAPKSWPYPMVIAPGRPVLPGTVW